MGRFTRGAWVGKTIAFRRALARLRLAVGLSSVCAPQLASATEAEPLASLPGLGAWLQTASNERGQRCTFRASRSHGNGLLVACGSAGLWEVAAGEGSALRLIRAHDVGGDVVGFFEAADGEPWLKVQLLQARPLGAIVGSPTEATAAAATPRPAVPLPEQGASSAAQPSAPPRPLGPSGGQPPQGDPRTLHQGRVVQSKGDVVLISLGTEHGLRNGDRIDLSVERHVVLAPGETALSREALAVGIVTTTSSRFARLRLGINERVPVGANARLTYAAATSSLTAPPRAQGLWQTKLMLRPFFALDELGGGFLLTGAAGYRFNGNLHVQALLEPFALAGAQDRDGVAAASFTLAASYDSHYVELGVGAGAQTVNTVPFDIGPGSGLSFAQFLRLGALDGLHLEARSTIVLFHSEFDFSGLTITSQIPVARGYWVLLGGGGGSVGYAYGELGLRVLLKGRGDRGSVFFSATAGGAAVFKETGCSTSEDFVFCDGTQTLGGPMAGVGVEHRF
jgi:hypothetical protein